MRDCVPQIQGVRNRRVDGISKACAGHKLDLKRDKTFRLSERSFHDLGGRDQSLAFVCFTLRGLTARISVGRWC